MLRGSRGAIRRTTSAPPGKNHPAGQDPRSAPQPLQVTHSNAPIRNEGQSFLSKKIALREPVGRLNPSSPGLPIPVSEPLAAK